MLPALANTPNNPSLQTNRPCKRPPTVYPEPRRVAGAFEFSLPTVPQTPTLRLGILTLMHPPGSAQSPVLPL
jgi:hypothetical protein